METDRLRVYAAGAALDYGERQEVGASRPSDQSADISAGGPPYRLLWCRLLAGLPAETPDERYFAEEVRPADTDSGGRITWETFEGGLADIVVHNVAEAADHTHLLAEGAILRVEERLSRASPPELVYLAYVVAGAPDPARLARIVSYDGGSTYTVQPVRREEQGFVDDGDPITAVPNLGELRLEEAGYLAGPDGYDRYVRIFLTPAGWTMVLHPPRLV